MAIYVNDGYQGGGYQWRQMNNIKGLISLAVLVFVAGIVLSILTGVSYYGGIICTTAIIMGFLGFFLLWKYKASGRVTVVSTSGGHGTTTVQSSSMMTHSYQQSMQQTVRSSSRSHSIVSMSSRTNVQRSSSVARLQDSGVLGWGGAPSSQPVDNGWMSTGNPAHGGHTRFPPPPPPPPHASQPGGYPQPGGHTQPGGYPQPGGHTQPGGYPQPEGHTQPGGYPQPGGHTQPGGYPQPGSHTQPGGFTTPGGNRPSSTVGGFTNPAAPSSRPGPSSYSDAPPPSYEDAVRLQGKS